jgi:rod shape determining protein RodA
MITMPTGHRLRNRDMTAAWRHVDIALCVLVALATGFGLLVIYSATHHGSGFEFVAKQAMFVAIGVVAMAAMAAIDYQKLRDWSRLIYAGALGSLCLVLVPGIGSMHKNIRAWFDIGPFQIQPAEFTKLATIIAVAAYLGGVVEEIHLKEVVVAVVMIAVPIGLILLQPDLGTALVFVVVAVGMLVVGGVPARMIVALVLIGVIGVVGILSSDTLDQYQKDRLTSFANPSAASEKVIYNTRQAQMAIASGSLTGKGLFEGPLTKGGSVPEQQTDFIFTVPGEELGFVGAGGLLLLLGGIVWRVWRTAQLARDPVGRLMCVGVLCMIVFHVFENVGMNLGMMPVTGIPLPFVSYGGSSTITAFAAMGLVMNVHMRRFA